MRSLKMIDGCKGTQVYALNPTASGAGGAAAGGGGVGEKFLQQLQDHLRVNSIRSKSHRRYQSFSQTNNVNSILAEALSIYGLPQTDLIEPQIDPCLKFVDFVGILADVYRRLENSPEFERSGVYMEQSWLRFERREDELFGVSAMDCSGWNMECPKMSLVSGYNPESAHDICSCPKRMEEEGDVGPDVQGQECSTSIFHDDGGEDDDYDMWFCIGDDEVRCNRYKIASLSRPFKSMLYGCFMESRKERIYFAQNGISAKAMRAAEVFSRVKSVESFDPNVVFELLVLANRFCCDEMKSACDAYLASLVDDMDTAVLLIEYGLEETAYLLVASCLQVFLRELPSSMHNPNVMKLFCSSEARERLALVGHASFSLYNFLSQIAMEEDIKSNTTVMLLERMGECATENWQKQLAFHQLGCVMLERKEYKDAQKWFEAAVQAGHVYSLVGVARAINKRGHKYKAYKLMNSLISDYTPSGWMYQERSLYSSGKENVGSGYSY
ncbi:hypothetical protein DH2020_040295 [Rehmannia glutinosa]|uniref:BTB domain-containing protein n=1 Tax=Rehmannia glutinosa TaxID=99300 RepID=A0ABR0UTL9_REHGL